jgi:hypothetical protein
MAALSPFFDGPADVREFEKNDIAKLRLRMIGDADRDQVTIAIEPLVIFSEILGQCPSPPVSV